MSGEVSEMHPSEIELALLSEVGDNEDREVDAEKAEHVRWCARCRGVVADHHWLQKEVIATLAVTASAVPVPRPKWWAVQEVLFASQQRRVRGWRFSTIASVVLAACLMLSASPVLGTAVIVQSAQMAFPEAMVVTAPLAGAIASGDQSVSVSSASFSDSTIPSIISMATPTPALREVQEMTPSPTPVLVMPPRPPQPET